jgi:hypothetical protein
MPTTKLFLIQLLIEADVTDWPDFDERKAAEHIRSAIKLLGADKIHHIQAYLLARKPDDPSAVTVEESEDRGFEVEVCQNAETVGTGIPKYFAVVTNPQAKTPYGSVGGDECITVEEAKEAARINVDKRIGPLSHLQEREVVRREAH